MTTAIRRAARLGSALPRGAASARRLVVVLFALTLATLVSAPARAAVPMCSSDGRSVAAPPIVMPWRMIELKETKSCPQPDNVLLAFAPVQRERAPSAAPTPVAPRAVPVERGELAAPASVRVPIVDAVLVHGRNASETPYRPPRV